nr:retrotransposon protein, putative, Ty1-copia subclass [Tanacetum cinerariifolium]
MFEREKLSGNNFNDWFCQLKLVLRVEKKMHVIEQPIPPAPAADSVANVLAEWNAVYDVHNENAKGKGKGKGKGKDKSYIPKPKHPKPNSEENPTKNDACHHYKEAGHWKRICPVYLAELMKNKKQVGSAISSGIFIIELYSFPIKSWDHGCNAPLRKEDVINGIYEIDMSNHVPNVNSIYNVSNKRVKHNLDFTYLWHCRLAHISKKRVEKLQQDGTLKSTDDESFDQCVSCLSGKMTRKLFSHRPERATDVLGLIHIGVYGPLRHVSRQGCEALVKRDTPNKLQQRSIKCIFIGYPKETMGYYFYFPNKIVVARYAEFFEKNLLSQEVSGRAGDLEEIQDEDTSPSEITSEIPVEVEGFEPPQEEEAHVRRSRAVSWISMALYRDYTEDLLNTKIKVINNVRRGRLVDLPSNGKTIGSKWLFKKKTDMNGNVHTYKARLVAKVFTQTYGVDYEETFSPVADIKAIRILIAIAAFYDYEILQMDVKTAFLNGYLDEDIYMVQPEGFIDHKHPRKVCKLQKSIYGLKQASKSLNKRSDEEIKKFGFTQNLDEPCVYQKASGSNVTFLILYVDDIIIMGNHILSLQSVKTYLGKCFAMKDLGDATFILRIKIYRDRSRRLIGLCQSAYMDKILKRYRMDNSKRGYILMQERLDLNKTQGASTLEVVKRMQNVPYASAVGSIMYAVRCTRPDVAFAQNITSHFQHNPGELHWTTVKTILKYLKNTKDMFLVYGGNLEAELRVECYCNAGFETDRDDTKSQTGYVFVLNRSAVDWKSSKQSTTAMSATDDEYIAASKAGMEAVWIKKFISGLV